MCISQQAYLCIYICAPAAGVYGASDETYRQQMTKQLGRCHRAYFTSQSLTHAVVGMDESTNPIHLARISGSALAHIHNAV